MDGSYADWARKNGYTIRNCVCDCGGSIELDTRTVGGPAMQAPTSKGQSFHKNISLFCDFTVGAGLALPAFAVPAS